MSAALATMMLASCQNEEIVNKATDGRMFTLEVSQGMDSRTTLTPATGGYQTLWSEGDQIYVTSEDGKTTGVLTLVSTPGSPNGTFQGFVFGEGDLCYISKYENSLGGKVIVNGYSAWEYTDTPANLNLFTSIAKWFDSPIYLNWKNPNVVSRVQPYIRTNGKKAVVMLVNASLDTTNPFEIAVKGEMTEAVLLNPDGSEIKLEIRRENDRVFANIPTINPWDIAFVLLR